MVSIQQFISLERNLIYILTILNKWITITGPATFYTNIESIPIALEVRKTFCNFSYAFIDAFHSLN